MRILIAPDKFKGVLSAADVAEIIAEGLRVLPDAVIETQPVADGGEGTAEIICRARNGSWRSCAAHDALGRPMEARYAWLEREGTAVLEMSETAGQKTITEEPRDPERATTFGVGEMLSAAARDGARQIVVGLGGSVTNDGGFGLARALGFRFFANDCELTGAVTDLAGLTRIEVPVELALPEIVAIADVRNPLLGETGATRIFGAQKGVTEDQAPAFERALRALAEVAARDFGVDHRDHIGAGAAGGLGFGLLTFCGASIRGGFAAVAHAVGLEERIRAADVVITGEGSLDRQTLDGKAPAEVARLARKLGKRIYAVVGLASEDKALRDLFDGVFAVAQPELSTAENVRCARQLLCDGVRALAGVLSSLT